MNALHACVISNNNMYFDPVLCGDTSKHKYRAVMSVRIIIIKPTRKLYIMEIIVRLKLDAIRRVDGKKRNRMT